MAVDSEARVADAPAAAAVHEPVPEPALAPVVAAVPPALPASSPAIPKTTPKASPKAVVSPAKAAPVVATQQPLKEAAPPPVARVQEPQMDMASLIARLRETNAIGAMTKLALKNQVDDLLKKFRAHYQTGQRPTVAELRQPYDMLVMKVLALVQDKDPSLARSISNSRRAIWEILTDREKFNAIA